MKTIHLDDAMKNGAAAIPLFQSKIEHLKKLRSKKYHNSRVLGKEEEDDYTIILHEGVAESVCPLLSPSLIIALTKF
jgi:hypothetical protein